MLDPRLTYFPLDRFFERVLASKDCLTQIESTSVPDIFVEIVAVLEHLRDVDGIGGVC